MARALVKIRSINLMTTGDKRSDWKEFENAKDYHNMKTVARLAMVMLKAPK